MSRLYTTADAFSDSLQSTATSASLLKAHSNNPCSHDSCVPLICLYEWSSWVANDLGDWHSS